jgi:serine/threonine protein kinase/tetratricopeptide (TPR) repeat protein
MARIGPVRLEKVVGRGGMGVVWSGRHEALDLPVAVKIDLSGPAGTELFLHEVRLVSQLEHPNVVRVLDHGRVPGPDAPDLPAGARYLVMEFCDGGSLADRRGADWPALRDAVLGTLAGLGHAHARGIVHRDVKPNNLLFQAGRVVVSDFGVSARGVDRDGPLAAGMVGTPRYMAPEQILGDIRAQGPWTDLYAVCVMIWQLVTGAHPYGAYQSSAEVIGRHLAATAGPFVPRVPVPAGLEEVLRVGLDKVGPRRWAFAADLAERLTALDGDDLVGPALGLAPPADPPTVTRTSSARASSRRRRADGGEPLDTPTRGGASIRAIGRRDRRFESAALSLWGFREVPLVDRVPERAALAARFDEVAARGAAAAVILTGPAGSGKSRLAAWLGRRLHERGDAHVIEIRHSAALDPGHGPWAMLARELGVDGLPMEEVDDRVAERVADEDLAADLPLALPQAARPLPGLVRRHLLERWLRARAADRPALLVVEDAAHGAESLEFVRELLQHQSPHPVPVLALILVRDGSLVDRPAERGHLDALRAAGVPTVEVGDLAPEHASVLVREHLGLSGALADEVEQRTAGNPLFAVELVGYWLERGWLRGGADGIELAAPALEVPAHLTEVWTARLDAWLEGRPAADGVALELAAWMGMDVDLAEWRAACQRAGLRPSPDLVDALLARALVRGGALPLERFRFAHGLLREALCARATEARRATKLHSAIADVLRGGDPDRLGPHLLAAGRVREAVPVLWAAASRQVESGDARERTRLDRAAAALDDAGLGEDAPERGRLGLLEGLLLLLRGQYEPADRHAAKLEESARRFGWEDVLPRALRLGGRANLGLGEAPHALELLDEAEKRFTARGETDSAADTWAVIGDVLAHLGRLDQAEAAYRYATGAVDARVRVGARLGLARLCKRRGDVAGALAWLEPEANLDPGILRGQLAPMVNERGELLRAQGRTAEAERTYERAAALYRSMGNPRAAYPLLNLALLQVRRADWSGARAAMEDLLRDLAGVSQPHLEGLARGVLLPCLAAQGDGAAFAEVARALEAWLAASDTREPDLAALLDLAATHAEEHGLGAWSPTLRARAARMRAPR